MSNENKLINTFTDSAVLIGLAAGVGYLAKKAVKEPYLNMYLKDYLETQKILPKPT